MGYQVSGSDLKATEVTDRLAAARRPRLHRPRTRATSRARRSSSTRPRCRPTTPSWWRAAPRGRPGHPARRDAGRADAHEVRRRGRRARTARPRRPRWSARCCARGGLDPTIVVGGRRPRARHERAARARPVPGRRGRRERRLVPAALAGDRRDHQHRPRAPRPLRRPRRPIRAGVRRTSPNRVPFYGVIVLCADDPEVRAILPQVTKRACSTAPTASTPGRARRRRRAGAARARASPWSAAGRRVGDGRAAGAGAPQRAQRAGGGRRRARARDRLRAHRRGAGALPRRRPPLRDPGEAAGRAGGRRLRPPPDRDRGHAAPPAAQLGGRVRGRSSSRTATRARGRLRSEFGACFGEADRVLVRDIYPAGEAPIPGVTAELIVAAARSARAQATSSTRATWPRRARLAGGDGAPRRPRAHARARATCGSLGDASSCKLAARRRREEPLRPTRAGRCGRRRGRSAGASVRPGVDRCSRSSAVAGGLCRRRATAWRGRRPSRALFIVREASVEGAEYLGEDERAARRRPRPRRSTSCAPTWSSARQSCAEVAARRLGARSTARWPRAHRDHDRRARAGGWSCRGGACARSTRRGVLLPPLVSGVVPDVPLRLGREAWPTRAPGQAIADPRCAAGPAPAARRWRAPRSRWRAGCRRSTCRRRGDRRHAGARRHRRVSLPAWPPTVRTLSALRVVLADLASRSLSASSIDLTDDEVVAVRPVPVAGSAADDHAVRHQREPRRG